MPERNMFSVSFFPATHFFTGDANDHVSPRTMLPSLLTTSTRQKYFVPVVNEPGIMESPVVSPIRLLSREASSVDR